MNKPWYGPVKDLHQEVICKYGQPPQYMGGSAKLIEYPEGFDCLGTCQDVDCAACNGTGGFDKVNEDEHWIESCIECSGSGKMSRERFAEYTLERESPVTPGDEKNV